MVTDSQRLIGEVCPGGRPSRHNTSQEPKPEVCFFFTLCFFILLLTIIKEYTTYLTTEKGNTITLARPPSGPTTQTVISPTPTSDVSPDQASITLMRGLETIVAGVVFFSSFLIYCNLSLICKLIN